MAYKLGSFNHRCIREGMDQIAISAIFYLAWSRRRIILKGKNKYLARVVWIGMGGCVRDNYNGLSAMNIGFESFMRGLNGIV